MSISRSFFSLLFFVSLFLVPMVRAGERERAIATEPVPLAYCASGDRERRFIIVDKSSQTLRLFRSPKSVDSAYSSARAAPLALQALYPVILGSKQGDKRTQGDLRTPEGLYHIQRWLPGQTLPIRYGLGAFTLDYPGYLDRLHGKTGNGIWIHGINPRQDKFDTKGCVALSNENLQLLKNTIHADTPVLITPKLAWGSENERQARYGQWRDRTLQWLAAWEQGDLEQFSGFYSKKFPRRAGFLANKKNVWRTYPVRSLALGPVEVYLENGHEVIVRFSHMYMADNLKEWGERILYWQKEENGSFKIVAQQWRNQGDVITNLFADSPILDTPENTVFNLWQKIRSLVTTDFSSDFAPMLHSAYRTSGSRWGLSLSQMRDIASQPKNNVSLSSPVGGLVDEHTLLLSFRIAVQTTHGRSRQGKIILVLRKEAGVFRVAHDFYYPEES